MSTLSDRIKELVQIHPDQMDALVGVRTRGAVTSHMTAGELGMEFMRLAPEILTAISTAADAERLKGENERMRYLMKLSLDYGGWTDENRAEIRELLNIER